MGVAATGEKSLGQRNQLRRSTPGCARACSQRWMNIRVTEDVFDPDARGAREHKFPFLRPIFPKCIVSGILQEQPAEIGFGAEMAVGDPAVDCRVIAFRSFQIAVPLVANVAEPWHAHTCRLREKWNEILIFDGDSDLEYTSYGNSVI